MHFFWMCVDVWGVAPRLFCDLWSARIHNWGWETPNGPIIGMLVWAVKLTAHCELLNSQ